MVGVQLIGKDSVIAAYNDLDVDTWAILQGKQLIVSGEGGESLGAWLERFAQCGTAAIYTLRCYDTESAPDSLTAGTNYIASFNFKFTDIYQPSAIGGYNNQLIGRIEELEKKLAAAKEEESDEPDILGAVMGWLQDPHKLQQAVGAFKMLTGGAGAVAPMPPPAQAVAGFDTSPRAQRSFEEEEQKVARLAAALDRLEKKDPHIVEHLEKLADIADKKPDTFKFLIGNLGSL